MADEFEDEEETVEEGVSETLGDILANLFKPADDVDGMLSDEDYVKVMEKFRKNYHDTESNWFGD
jgi:hypothetical protein